MTQILKKHSRKNPGFPFQGYALVVDENNAVRDVGQRMMERIGFPTITAGDGRETLEILRLEGRGIGLIIMSADLEPIEGLSPVQYVRGSWPEIPLALVMSTADSDTKAYYLSIGVCGVIEKPFGMEDLRVFIQNMRRHVAFYCDAEPVRT
ncbi:MAG: response regulator [Candidatus Sumerlaeia bacterium]